MATVKPSLTQKDSSLLDLGSRRYPVRTARCSTVWALLLSILLVGLSTEVRAQPWEPFGLAGTSLNTVARDPSNPQLVLGGPGPENGIGLWRSTDGGVRWELVSDGLTGLHRVNTIAYRQIEEGTPPGPGATELILIGLFEYSAQGAGLYRSVDQGRTWQPSIAGMQGSRHEITSIVFDPDDPKIVYASHNDPDGGVSKSTDGGSTWFDVSSGLGPDGFCAQGCVLDLVIDPSAPSVLYAALPGRGDVYKTTTGGAEWFPTGLGFLPERLALDPRDPDTLFVTGSVFNLGGVARSQDGGETWTNSSDQPGLPPLRDTSHRSIAVDPSNPDTVWLVSEEVFGDGSSEERVYRSVDGGLTWEQSDGGLESASKYHDLVPDGSSMLAATDNGVYRWAAMQPLCVRDERTACLLNRRFLVEGEMSTFSQPPQVVPVEVMQFDGRAESDQAVFFESFAAGNFEVGVKMVDACDLPEGHPQRGHWLFLGGLTNAAASLRVEDTARPLEDYVWENAAGSFPQSLGLVAEFSCDAVQPASCARSATAACLIGGRFRVTGEMLDFGEPPQSFATRVMEFSGRAESDQAVFFESFASGNFEVGVKMVDACGLPPGHPQRGYWTFFGGLTNAATEIRIRDTVTGTTERWNVAAGDFPVSVGTTPAFPCDGDS